MQVKLSGVISISVEDESLFDGQPLPVSFMCEVDEDSLEFADAKVQLNFSVPVELSISEDEWSRAVGEVLARAIHSPSSSS